MKALLQISIIVSLIILLPLVSLVEYQETYLIHLKTSLKLLIL
jgi:hypothetical protein